MDEPHTPENQQQRQRSHQRYSSEDLLAPSSKFNKQEFQDKCLEDIEETGAEQQALMDEYAQWDWVNYHIAIPASEQQLTVP